MDAAKTEQKISAAIYDLKGMELSLRLPAGMFVKGTLTEAKAKLSYTAINRFLFDNVALTRLADDKGFVKLPKTVQAEAQWLDGVMTTLSALDPLLDKAWRIAKKGADGQADVILKHAKLCVKEVRTQPRTLVKLVRRMVQGQPLTEVETAQIALLPMSLMCWAVADQVDHAMTMRPR